MGDKRAALRMDPKRRGQRGEKKGYSRQTTSKYGREMGQHSPFTATRKKQHNRRQGLTAVLCAHRHALPL